MVLIELLTADKENALSSIHFMNWTTGDIYRAKSKIHSDLTKQKKGFYQRKTANRSVVPLNNGISDGLVADPYAASVWENMNTANTQSPDENKTESNTENTFSSSMMNKSSDKKKSEPKKSRTSKNESFKSLDIERLRRSAQIGMMSGPAFHVKPSSPKMTKSSFTKYKPQRADLNPYMPAKEYSSEGIYTGDTPYEAYNNSREVESKVPLSNPLALDQHCSHHSESFYDRNHPQDEERYGYLYENDYGGYDSRDHGEYPPIQNQQYDYNAFVDDQNRNFVANNQRNAGNRFYPHHNESDISNYYQNMENSNQVSYPIQYRPAPANYPPQYVLNRYLRDQLRYDPRNYPHGSLPLHYTEPVVQYSAGWNNEPQFYPSEQYYQSGEYYHGNPQSYQTYDPRRGEIDHFPTHYSHETVPPSHLFAPNPYDQSCQPYREENDTVIYDSSYDVSSGEAWGEFPDSPPALQPYNSSWNGAGYFPPSSPISRSQEGYNPIDLPSNEYNAIPRVRGRPYDENGWENNPLSVQNAFKGNNSYRTEYDDAKDVLDDRDLDAVLDNVHFDHSTEEDSMSPFHSNHQLEDRKDTSTAMKRPGEDITTLPPPKKPRDLSPIQNDEELVWLGPIETSLNRLPPVEIKSSDAIIEPNEVIPHCPLNVNVNVEIFYPHHAVNTTKLPLNVSKPRHVLDAQYRRSNYDPRRYSDPQVILPQQSTKSTCFIEIIDEKEAEEERRLAKENKNIEQCKEGEHDSVD